FLADLNRRDPVVPGARRIIRGVPRLHIWNVSSRRASSPAKIRVVVDCDFRAVHDLNGRDAVVVAGRKIRIALAPAHAEIFAGVIDLFVEAGSGVITPVRATRLGRTMSVAWVSPVRNTVVC